MKVSHFFILIYLPLLLAERSNPSKSLPKEESHQVLKKNRRSVQSTSKKRKAENNSSMLLPITLLFSTLAGSIGLVFFFQKNSKNPKKVKKSIINPLERNLSRDKSAEKSEPYENKDEEPLIPPISPSVQPATHKGYGPTIRKNKNTFTGQFGIDPNKNRAKTPPQSEDDDETKTEPLKNEEERKDENGSNISIPQKHLLPNHAKKVTLASKNQYNTNGPAACAFFAAGMAKAILKNKNINLHDTKFLDQVLAEAAKEHKDDMAAYIDQVTSKYTLDIGISAYHEERNYNNFHDTKGTALEEIKFEIKNNGYGRIAIVRNGPEAWTFFAKDKNTFFITESHGRTDQGLTKAYVLEFSTLKDAVDYIEDYNNYLQEPNKYNDVLDEEKKRAQLSFDWINGFIAAKA